jgi:hypothetical protein
LDFYSNHPTSPIAHSINNRLNEAKTFGKTFIRGKNHFSPALTANIQSQWADLERGANRREENTKAKSINRVAIENTRGESFAPFFRSWTRNL